jgi:hypothetical protein
MSHSHQPNREPETDTVVKSIDPDRTKLSASILTWAAAIATAISCTYAASNWMNTLTGRMDGIENRLKVMDRKLDSALALMWSEQDQRNFALELQLQNPSLKVPMPAGSSKQFADSQSKP